MKLIFVVLFLATSTVSGRHGGSSHGGSSHTSHSHPGRGSGGTHSYPPSHGMSGSGNTNSYHPQQTHSYPPSHGMSGNTNSYYPQQTQHQPATQHSSHSTRTEYHHHYHYNPPQQIMYGGSTHYPVYVGQPPQYVYVYRESGSRFDSLLTGLALYNLGRNSHVHHYSSDRQYSSSPGETCKLAISESNGKYEEARIDCNLMSSFIWDVTPSTTQNDQHIVKNTTQVTVTTTVNGTGNSSVTTVTSSTVQDAMQVKGPSIAVTPGMTCFLIRTFRDSTHLRKPVDCGLLQEYSRSSLQRSGAQCLEPVKIIIFSFLVIYFVRY